MAAIDRDRPLRLKTSLGENVLLLSRLGGQEALGQLFEYDLHLISEQGDIDSEKLLAQTVSVEIALPDGKQRHIHGFVTEFAQTGYGERYHHYHATIRPWLWFLTRTSDCRIFQDKTVPDIFEAVVRGHGFHDYELRFKDKSVYEKWEYCVQYRETDFNFLSRLLEQEGIYYYFVHEAGKHTLVLVDDPSAHKPQKGYEKVPYFPPTADEAQRERDHLTSWSLVRSVQTGAYATSDFDFEQPRKEVLGKSQHKRPHPQSELEIFDYPAEPQDFGSSAMNRLAALRLDELQVAYAVARGGGDAAGLMAGHVFTLEKYPRADLNIEYLITSSHLSVASDAYETADGGGTEISVSVQAIDARTVFRPPRITPKPVVQGAQTALVVGKAGEEIWTDKYGRVKVQFPWDRHGKRDENSSCWIRVAQVWAGEKWGAIHIPRIGQEVIVSFLEGDPDQPIITGRVYNGTHQPPYDLPANQTQSGIKSRSSKSAGPDNFNEIRFEDKKGEELLSFHAEKDLATEVENDQSIDVGNDEQVTIGRDRTSEVGNNETLEVGNDRETTIGNNETRSIGKDRHTDIGENEVQSVGKDRTRKVGQNETLKIGKKYVLEVGDEITIKTGASSITMKKDGTITLKGVKITINGSQSITEKAGQKVEVQALQLNSKGTKVQVQGTMVDVKASAVASVKGALTKIG